MNNKNKQDTSNEAAVADTYDRTMGASGGDMEGASPATEADKKFLKKLIEKRTTAVSKLRDSSIEPQKDGSVIFR